jgi:16S rRNA (guanine(966)-N(2))-methyltransferase RsmD
MRVISGKYRGRTLQGPKHKGLRPTADRVKEALFNIIGPRIIDADFLDLFAGTGGIGIEALSRGAASVVFSDINPQSIKLLRQNISFLTPQEKVTVFQLRADKTIEVLAAEEKTFDLVFLDPPFEADLLETTIIRINEFNLLRDGGWLIAEHPDKIELFENGAPFVKTDIRSYGDICLTFFLNSGIESK